MQDNGWEMLDSGYLILGYWKEELRMVEIGKTLLAPCSLPLAPCFLTTEDTEEAQRTTEKMLDSGYWKEGWD